MKLIQIMSGADGGGAEGFFERLAISLHKDGEIKQKLVIRHNKRRFESNRKGI